MHVLVCVCVCVCVCDTVELDGFTIAYLLWMDECTHVWACVCMLQALAVT